MLNCNLVAQPQESHSALSLQGQTALQAQRVFCYRTPYDAGLTG